MQLRSVPLLLLLWFQRLLAKRPSYNRAMHNRNMQHKMDNWMAEFDAGLLDSSQWPRLNYTKCVDGVRPPSRQPAADIRCRNMDLYDFIKTTPLWADLDRLSRSHPRSVPSLSGLFLVHRLIPSLAS